MAAQQKIDPKNLTDLEEAESIDQVVRSLSRMIQDARASAVVKPGSRVDVMDQRVRSTQSVSRPKDWEVSLVTGVSRAFGCVVMWESGRSQDEDYWGKYHVVGRSEAVNVAQFAVKTILKQAVRERTKFRRQLSEDGLTRGAEMTLSIDSLCWLWVDSILRRLPKGRLERNEVVVRAVECKVVELTREARALGVRLGPRATYEIYRPIIREN